MPELPVHGGLGHFGLGVIPTIPNRAVGVLKETCGSLCILGHVELRVAPRNLPP